MRIFAPSKKWKKAVARPNLVVLRNIAPSDLPIFFLHQCDPDAVTMAAFTAKEPSNRAAFDAFWARIMADDHLLRFRDFPREIMEYEPAAGAGDNGIFFQDELAVIERAKVVEVLRRENGNKTRAARTLGIDRRKLYRLVEKYDIQAVELAKTTA